MSRIEILVDLKKAFITRKCNQNNNNNNNNEVIN